MRTLILTLAIVVFASYTSCLSFSDQKSSRILVQKQLIEDAMSEKHGKILKKIVKHIAHGVEDLDPAVKVAIDAAKVAVK